jgi:hypothetical protein
VEMQVGAAEIRTALGIDFVKLTEGSRHAYARRKMVFTVLSDVVELETSRIASSAPEPVLS